LSEVEWALLEIPSHFELKSANGYAARTTRRAMVFAPSQDLAVIAAASPS
jgi:hypothetical protein